MHVRMCACMHAHAHIKTKTKNHIGKNKQKSNWSICKLIQHLAGYLVLLVYLVFVFLSVSFHLSFQHLTQMWDRDWQLSFSKLYPTHQAHETRGKHRPSDQKQKSLVNNVTYTGGHSLVNNARHILHWRTQSNKQCQTQFTEEDTIW